MYIFASFMRFDSDRNVRVNDSDSASLRSAPLRSASLRFASLRFASLRFASPKNFVFWLLVVVFAWVVIAPLRSAHNRFARGLA